MASLSSDYHFTLYMPAGLSPDSQPITAGQGIESENTPAIKIQIFSIIKYFVSTQSLTVLHFDMVAFNINKLTQH